MVVSLQDECIIAHVPFFDDVNVQSEDDTVTTLLKALEPSETVSTGVRERLISFLKKNLKNSCDHSKGVVGKEEQDHIDPMARSVSLPVHHLDGLSQSKDISCWWCTFTPDENIHPVFLPHWVLDGVFHVSGFFCSLNCALAYNMSKKDTSVFQRANLMTLMYSHLVSPSRPLLPAPSKEILLKFGGFMSIQEFRNHSTVLSQDTRLLLPPIKSIFYTIESQKRFTSSYPRSSTYVPMNHEHVSKAREKLKLKRNAPRKSNYISLEETMGITKRPK